MTIGIYVIEHTTSLKKYVGKSCKIESRFSAHRWALKLPAPGRQCNRYLWAAVRKDGLAAFRFRVIETFDQVDEAKMAERELYWMDRYGTTDRDFGYNLRRDSSTKMVVHEDTRVIMREIFKGADNPNYGNKWSQQQRDAMSEITKERHRLGFYKTEQCRLRKSEIRKKFWANPENAKKLAEKLKIVKRKYHFYKYDRSGKLLEIYTSLARIIELNPGYKWQNIYSVCNGYKPTYMGFVWRSRPMEELDL